MNKNISFRHFLIKFSIFFNMKRLKYNNNQLISIEQQAINRSNTENRFLEKKKIIKFQHLIVSRVLAKICYD